MKSPWKFLVGLTRRHDRHDAPDVISALSEEAASDSNENARTVELESAPASPNLELGAPASALEDDPEHIEDLPTLAAIAAAAAEAKGDEPVVGARQVVGKGPRRRASKMRAEISSTPVQLATPGDHALELDNEIRRLRLQLEQKLRVQNAQLRQMLARFED
ncbi:hypothetical protein [Rhizobium sp. Root1220]|uniref:hypothetical protein n=1 Tax=Rhizobium sp. Root1220 TaxID=1736432 RepID=UPI0006FED642|nr:hypothetical protein [Rhizobium sp. Root1220]KQV80549.1 hypothetical protein ASC90_25515 [Rhizobium sp. Root1220]